MNNMKEKPSTPQKYGYAHKVIPIRKRIWQKVLIRWVILLGVGVMFLILNGIGEKVPTLRNYYHMVVLMRWMSVFVFLAILFMSRVLPLTFSREWVGTVRERKVDKYTRYPKGIYNPVGGDRPVLATRCTWKVELDNGDIEMPAFDTEEIWERYFEIGERVRMYKNAKILVKAHPPKDDENLMCPLCGVMVMEPICRKCGVDFHEEEPAEDAAAE
jgi:hypothetical protein